MSLLPRYFHVCSTGNICLIFDHSLYCMCTTLTVPSLTNQFTKCYAKSFVLLILAICRFQMGKKCQGCEKENIQYSSPYCNLGDWHNLTGKTNLYCLFSCWMVKLHQSALRLSTSDFKELIVCNGHSHEPTTLIFTLSVLTARSETRTPGTC